MTLLHTIAYMEGEMTLEKRGKERGSGEQDGGSKQKAGRHERSAKIGQRKGHGGMSVSLSDALMWSRAPFMHPRQHESAENVGQVEVAAAILHSRLTAPRGASTSAPRTGMDRAGDAWRAQGSQ